MKSGGCYYQRCSRQWELFSICKSLKFVIIPLLAVLVCGLNATSISAADEVSELKDSPIVTKCKADLSRRLKVSAKWINLVDENAVTWPDAALGMPEIDTVYAQAQTPGSRVVLEAIDSQYLYTTSGDTVKYGGPLPMWEYSALYTKLNHEDPNLNSDLYQCSLLGTNNIRLISGVADYYPQEKGMIVAKRRTSRSSYDLLYIKADKAEEVKTIYSAPDFGDIAVNTAQDKWAGFVRTAAGVDWCVVVAHIGKDNAKLQSLALPQGVRPGKIAWAGEMLMILVPLGDETVCFETSSTAATPEWKRVGNHNYPGIMDYVLNKSETLEVTQSEKDGKPAVEVARVWFNGNRYVKARIVDFILRKHDLLGSYAFILGEIASKPSAFTVDVSTGEIIPCSSGIGTYIKPFRYPPYNSALLTKGPK